MTKEDIYKKLENDEYCVGALISIFDRQTLDEKASYTTGIENSMGFNKFDAGILSSISSQYLAKGTLTNKQIACVRKNIKKYWAQILQYDPEPLPLKRIEKKSKQKTKGVCIVEDMYQVHFTYDPELVKRVKTLEFRKWNPKLKIWTAPVTNTNTRKLIEFGFKVPQAQVKKLAKFDRGHDTKQIKMTLPRSIVDKLWLYQKEGIKHIESRNGRALVADQMGLGKTAQAICWLKATKKQALPVVIVVPASLKYNWLKELKMWGKYDEKDILILNGFPNGNKDQIKGKPIIVVNYDILINKTEPNPDKNAKKKRVEVKGSGWADVLVKRGLNTLILDEAHKTKNKQAARTKACLKLGKKAKYVIALTGTPVLNRPVEIFNIANLIDRETFPSFWKFAHKFCGAKHNGFGWDFTGSSNTGVLNDLLTKSIMIRRLKEDVLKDLPPKHINHLTMSMEKGSKYHLAENAFLAYLAEYEDPKAVMKAKRAEVLVKMNKLMALVAECKIKSCIEWIEDTLEQEDKLAVYAHHKSTIDTIMKKFKKVAVKIDGSVSQKARQEAVDQFQNNPDIKLFVGNIQAAGEGITITAANNLAFLELAHTPGAMDQAEDRVHRIGQEKEVSIWYLLTEGTIEQDRMETIKKKRKIIEQVLDGKEVEDINIEEETLQAMIERLEVARDMGIKPKGR